MPIPVVKPIFKIINKPIIMNKCCKTCGEQCIKRIKRNIINDTIVIVNSACSNKMLGKIIAKVWKILSGLFKTPLVAIFSWLIILIN